MKEEIKVTVLMSVYNEKEKELKQAIESILNQTYREYEFLIINDGQNEKLNNIIKSYKDERIRLIQNERNIGLAASLNKGIGLANGKYIVRMDADDISYSDRIYKQVQFIESHPQYAIISGNAEIFDENGIYAQTHTSGEMEKENLIMGTPFIHPTMIINKEMLKKTNCYPDYRRAQDYAMAMNMYAHGYKGYVMDEILLQYRMDKNGYKKKKFKYRIMEMQIRFKYFKRMKINPFLYIYILKPIVVGIIPKIILKKYHERKMKYNG